MSVEDVSFADLERLRQRVRAIEVELARRETEVGYCVRNGARACFNQRCADCETRMASMREEMRSLYREMDRLIRERQALFPTRRRRPPRISHPRPQVFVEGQFELDF